MTCELTRIESYCDRVPRAFAESWGVSEQQWASRRNSRTWIVAPTSATGGRPRCSPETWTPPVECTRFGRELWAAAALDPRTRSTRSRSARSIPCDPVGSGGRKTRPSAWQILPARTPHLIADNPKSRCETRYLTTGIAVSHAVLLTGISHMATQLASEAGCQFDDLLVCLVTQTSGPNLALSLIAKPL